MIRVFSKHEGVWAYNSLLVFLSFSSSLAFAGPTEQCQRMFNRIAGVQPTDGELETCVAAVSAGNVEEAATQAMNQPTFYSDTLRYMFSPWTNEDENILVALNDMSATLIGMTRDDVDFREALSGDLVYTCENDENLPPYSNENNDHYETCGANLDLATSLVRKTQTELNPILANREDVPAGLYTTRGFAQAYYTAGTNRAATANTLKNFLCEEIDAFLDTSIPDFRIRQDVDRNPGGKASDFVNQCKGCHAGMDGLTGAFAYVDFDEEQGDGAMTLSTDSVVSKFFNNAETFVQGFQTTSDEWMNLWTEGINKRVGWGVVEGELITGKGPKSLGAMFTASEQYPKCLAQTVYKRVCYDTLSLTDQKTLDLAAHFTGNGYRMKPLVAKAASFCMGE